MSMFHWFFLAGFAICFISCIARSIQILKSSKINNYSQNRGEVSESILYSFTRGMSPFKKETAYLHWPTYVAGILFHFGIFLSFILLGVQFFNPEIIRDFASYLFIFLIMTSICGISILLKRIFLAKLRNISNPDDYFSNVLVTGFQVISAIALMWSNILPLLFIYSGVLFLYIPISKLKHIVYFTTSRIHLGIFYGLRGVWPSKKRKLW